MKRGHNDLAKPSQAKPSQAKPSQAKPSQAKPSQAKPSSVRLLYFVRLILLYTVFIETPMGAPGEFCVPPLVFFSYA